MSSANSVDKKYLFQLDTLNNQISVIDYIKEVVMYEKKYDYHLDNEEFHKYRGELSRKENFTNGEIDSIK